MPICKSFALSKFAEPQTNVNFYIRNSIPNQVFDFQNISLATKKNLNKFTHALS